jgi:hypothetical protein
MKDRIEVFEENGKRFVSFDLSHFKSNTEFAELISLAKEKFKEYPPDAAFFSITNIEGVVYDTKTKEIVAQWMEYNRPYVKCGAVIGWDGLKKIMVNAILKMSGRHNMKFFRDRQEAVAWLSKQ